MVDQRFASHKVQTNDECVPLVESALKQLDNVFSAVDASIDASDNSTEENDGDDESA